MPPAEVMPRQILDSMRQMAWSRAKGELRSILDTFWYESQAYEDARKLIEDFIEMMDNDSVLA